MRLVIVSTTTAPIIIHFTPAVQLLFPWHLVRNIMYVLPWCHCYIVANYDYNFNKDPPISESLLPYLEKLTVHSQLQYSNNYAKWEFYSSHPHGYKIVLYEASIFPQTSNPWLRMCHWRALAAPGSSRIGLMLLFRLVIIPLISYDTYVGSMRMSGHNLGSY